MLPIICLQPLQETDKQYVQTLQIAIRTKDGPRIMVGKYTAHTK